jgi:hypothetical protein
MWPDHVASENAVHAVLASQKMGIVWIGLKGIYALKEWGYQRPSKSLFSTVAEIVRSKYQEIGKPISINLITAELGKHRKLVKPQSLAIAVGCNPLITRVGKDIYLPHDQGEEKSRELGLDNLDKSLEEFQKSSNKKIRK